MDPESVRLSLPPVLVSLAEGLAKERHKPDARSHAGDMDGEDWNYELIGALTEVAFCWWAGIELPALGKLGTDGGVDAVLPDGRKIQIKGTARPDLNLLVPCRHYNKVRICDVIVLGGVPKGMKAEDGAVDLVGWTTPETFYHEAILTADKYARKMYRLTRKLLNPMRNLL